MVWGGAQMKRRCEHRSFVPPDSVQPTCSYFTDSLVNIIHAYDYDDGKISNRRVFVDALAQGLPAQTFCDGFCIDSEGCIWSARFVEYCGGVCES
jgi:hypothetical protein